MIGRLRFALLLVYKTNNFLKLTSLLVEPFEYESLYLGPGYAQTFRV